MDASLHHFGTSCTAVSAKPNVATTDAPPTRDATVVKKGRHSISCTLSLRRTMASIIYKATDRRHRAIRTQMAASAFPFSKLAVQVSTRSRLRLRSEM
jgi:hypothetical protein